MIYLDNAATSYPKPTQVRTEALKVFFSLGANPGRGGHKMAMDAAMMVYSAREALAALFSLPEPEGVVFTQNCTAALNLAIKGVLKPGDHVVISSLEHNSVYRPVESLHRAGLITYDIATVDPASPQNTLAAFAACMRPNTRLVILCHGSNVFGTLQPAKEICALAHEQGALFLLDAAQTGGVIPIDLTVLPADLVALALHKGLYAPPALGALLVNTTAVITPLLEGGSGNQSMLPTMPEDLPEHLEAGTLPTTAIAGLLGGVQFVRQRGIGAIHQQEMSLLRQLRDGLLVIPKIIVYGDPVLPVLSFNIEGRTGEESAALLSEMGFALRGGFHCAPLAHKTFGTQHSGTVRVSVGVFNTPREVSALLDAVKRLGPGRL